MFTSDDGCVHWVCFLYRNTTGGGGGVHNLFILLNLHRCNDSVMDYLMSFTVDVVILATGQSCVVYDSPCSEKYIQTRYIYGIGSLKQLLLHSESESRMVSWEHALVL